MSDGHVVQCPEPLSIEKTEHQSCLSGGSLIDVSVIDVGMIGTVDES